MVDIIKILGEAGDDSTIVRHLPARDRSFYPIWQKGKPWLEQENNLLVGSMVEMIRQFNKGLLGSGFTQAGTYTYPGAADNKFRMAESRAVIDGLILHLGDPDNSQLNVITLPAATGVRNDLVFLEMWPAEVAPTGATYGNTSVYKQGGVGNAAQTNDIKDPTMAGLGFDETTRRVQIRWRIRTLASVDFTTYPTGLLDPIVLAQGDKGAPVATYTFSAVTGEISGTLYRAGAGNAQSFTDLGSLDGYVYAIPIAKVARTASTVIAAPDVIDMRSTVGYASAALSYVTTATETGLSGEKVLGTDVIMAGTLGARPAASLNGRMYFATDDRGGTLYRDNGATWDQLALSNVNSFGWFGDGSDGNVSIAGTTTLTRDMFYDELTIDVGGILNTNGFRVFAKTSILVNGTIRNNGSTPIGGAAGGGAGANVLGLGTNGGLGSVIGAAAPQNGVANTNAFGGAGGNGGVGTFGGGTPTGGTITAPAATGGGFRTLPYAVEGHILGAGSLIRINGGAGGAGGSGDAGGTQIGGGGGGGGGIIILASPTVTISATGIIEAKGGNGADGATDAGGGGGGGGGVVVIVSIVYDNSGSVASPGGSGGAAGGGGAGAGVAGSSGMVLTLTL